MPFDRRSLLRSAGVATGTMFALAITACSTSEPGPPRTTAVPKRAPAAAPPSSAAGTEAGELPLAVHDAVVPGLLPGPVSAATATGFLEHDLLLHADRTGAPIAVLPARNFLRDPTVVAATAMDRDWSFVLTPARRELPSTAGPADAQAQTGAWARTEDLPAMRPATASLTVHVGEQTMTITTPRGTRRYQVGVGTDATPTPTSVSGYLQARFSDPDQGLTLGTIHLTSLHATAADEPYVGSDGGLIAIHGSATPRGRSSHGCVRVPEEVVEELVHLPLGTPIVLLA